MDDVDQADVRRRMESWANAVAARDIDRVMSFYVPGDDFVGFDFVPPFVFAGADAFRKEWAATFRLFDEDPTFELKNMQIRCSADLGVAYGLSHFEGVTRGEPIDIWTRQTNAFRKIDGRWLMIHEHVSVPIDMKNMKGVIDFKPQVEAATSEW